MAIEYIVIFSRPIRTGKTTELKAFAEKHTNVTGILSPDGIAGRQFYDIAKNHFFDFEVDENYSGETLSVGKFRFSRKAFKTACEIICAAKTNQFLIIDEIGKLEVERNEGLEKAICESIKKFNGKEVSGRLLLVIRDTLLENAISKYGIAGAKIIHSLDEL